MPSIDYYCGGAEHPDSFSDLCHLGQFRIVFQLLYIPVVAIGSFFTVVTIWLLKKQSPHDVILIAIAVTDFAKGVVFSLFHVLKSIPDTEGMISGQSWTCALFYNMAWVVNFQSFDILILMCVDRYLMTLRPIWYRHHVNKSRNIKAILGLVIVRLAIHVGIAIKNIVELRDEPWSFEICNRTIFVPFDFQVANTVVFNIALVFGFYLCISVVIKAWRVKDQEVKTNAIFLSSLVFSFLILYIPSSVYLVWIRFSLNNDNPHAPLIEDIAFLCRVINAGINAPILAASRQIYRQSFKYMLTTPPSSWRDLPRWLKRLEQNIPSPTKAKKQSSSKGQQLLTLLHNCLPGTKEQKASINEPTPCPTPIPCVSAISIATRRTTRNLTVPELFSLIRGLHAAHSEQSISTPSVDRVTTAVSDRQSASHGPSASNTPDTIKRVRVMPTSSRVDLPGTSESSSTDPTYY